MTAGRRWGIEWAASCKLVALLALAVGCARTDRALVPAVPEPHRIQAFFGSGAWQVRADDPWWGLVDVRDMLNLFHPLVPSKTGAWAGATRDVLVPDGWRPPFSLRFYCADDYVADLHERPGALGVENFFAHRFKQVLIDDQVIWERDVVDEAAFGSPTTFTVDVTPYVRPGRPFRLTFRVFDRSASWDRHEGDVRFVGGTWYAPGDGRTELPPRFHTAVWFADPVFGEADAVRGEPLGQRPHDALVARRHSERGAIAPRGAPPSTSATLELLAPQTIPASGFPIETGVPLPRGSLRDAQAIRLVAPGGGDIPVQARPAAFWPDGTLRAVVLQALLPGGSPPGERFRLNLGGAPLEPGARVEIRPLGAGVRLDTGAIALTAGMGPGLIDAVSSPRSAGPVLRDLSLRMAMLWAGQRVPVAARRSEVAVIDHGPLAATLEVRGQLEAPGLHVGRFTLRVSGFVGLADLRMSFRVVDELKASPFTDTEADPPLEVLDLALVAKVLEGRKPRAGRDGAIIAAQRGIEVVQEAADHAVVHSQGGPAEEGTRIDGWVSTDAVELAGWRLAEQYPTALAVEGKTLEVGLFRSTAATPAYRPRFGEAKRHDLWLRLFPDHQEDARVAALVNEPPRFFDATWFASSGAIAVVDPAWFAHQPELARWAERRYGQVQPRDWPGSFGIRDFGDAPYHEPGRWKNGYWAMIEGPVAWALGGGNPQWLYRSHEVARHVADVDSVHLPEGHPDFAAVNGMTCAAGRDHSVHGASEQWSAFQAGDQLLLDAWLTGDRDSLAAGLANADYLVRTGLGLGSNGVREQTRPLRVLLRAWETTRDARYLRAAERYLDLDALRANVLDFRRGAYLTPIYKNWVFVSAGLCAQYAIAVDEYYRATGDERAAQVEVAIADSVYAETMLPQEEALGSFFFYPRYNRGAHYFAQIAVMLHIAFDLTLDTRFLRAARAAFARYLLAKDNNGGPFYQDVGNHGWLDPELGGWILEHREVKTEPLRILSETPHPDPAAFGGYDPAP